jgi:hypothetical protein
MDNVMATIRCDKDKVIFACKDRLKRLHVRRDEVEAKAQELDHQDRRIWIRRYSLFHMIFRVPLLNRVAAARALRYKFMERWCLDGYIARFGHKWILDEMRQVETLLTLCIRGDSSKVELDQADINLLKWDKTIHEKHRHTADDVAG